MRRAPSWSCAPRGRRCRGSCRSWPAACATSSPSPTRLEAGESPAQVKDSLKGSPWAADRRIKEARATDAATLRRALEALAELEVASRGQSELGDDTEALRAIATIAA